MDKQLEIGELFSMFHDFEIKGFKLDSELLTLNIEIPWPQIWKPPIYDYQIRLELFGVKDIVCEYYLIKSDEANISKPWALRESEIKYLATQKKLKH